MRRALLISAVAVCLVVLSVSAYGQAYAVAKPATQTVPIKGTAAYFDGSDSYTEEPPCGILEWAWDFDPSTSSGW